MLTTAAGMVTPYRHEPTACDYFASPTSRLSSAQRVSRVSVACISYGKHSAIIRKQYRALLPEKILSTGKDCNPQAC
ncbi:hypothetical protein KCP76_25260 [Salmonella enterica subsp. enterica serovar Weltevreden]|nr:hypothetical protein KCP76_25260 [Salmonella enterica subsp. enterica serovar Weltevreden]